MPTGVALRDAREQMFAAAERVLLRDGPAGLTSRAVTGEAGLAKGVLHRHFTDFDDFLAALVRDRIARLGPQAEALVAAAGTGTVVGNLTDVLTDLFGSVAAGLVGLLIVRDELRERLAAERAEGLPLLSQAAGMLRRYLRAEQECGRVDAAADVANLAPVLLGGGHILYADRTGTAPEPEHVRRAVAAALAGVLTGE